MHERILPNDPFKQQMLLSVETEVPRYVSYSVLRILRNPVQQDSVIVAKVVDHYEDSIPRLTAAKKPRPHKEMPLEVDMINSIIVLPDGTPRQA